MDSELLQEIWEGVCTAPDVNLIEWKLANPSLPLVLIGNARWTLRTLDREAVERPSSWPEVHTAAKAMARQKAAERPPEGERHEAYRAASLRTGPRKSKSSTPAKAVYRTSSHPEHQLTPNKERDKS